MKQFTVLNLMLFITVSCLALGWYSTHRKLQQEQTRVSHLHNETGKLAIKDPSKIQLRTMRTMSNRTSRFRIRFPADNQYDFVVGPVTIKQDGTIQFDQETLKKASRYPFRNFHGGKDPRDDPYAGECEVEFYVEPDSSSPRWDRQPDLLVMGVRSYIDHHPLTNFVANETGLDLKRFKLEEPLQSALLDKGPNYSPQIPQEIEFSPMKFSPVYEYFPDRPLMLVMKNAYQVWKDGDGNDLIVYDAHYSRERTVFIIAIVPHGRNDLVWSSQDWLPYQLDQSPGLK